MALSTQQFTSTGVEDHMILSFPYLAQDDVRLYFDSVAVPFTWASSTRIDFTPAPAGTEVVARRITARDKLAYLLQEGAPFTRKILDDIHTQLLYLEQEGFEGSIDGVYGDLDMHGFKARNAGDPTDDTDYTTKRWVEQLVFDAIDGDLNYLHELYASVYEALRMQYLEGGYTLRPKTESFRSGGTLTSSTDVLLDWVSGKAYSAPGPYPKTVPSGTVPTSPFVDRSGASLRINLGAVGSVIPIAGTPAKDLVYNSHKQDQIQDWGRVGAATKTVPDPRILVQRGGTYERLFVYINHYSNYYQQWEFTRGGGAGDGFDNAIPTHPNGNMFMLNQVGHVMVGPVQTVPATSPAMIKSGTYSIFGDDLRIDNGYAETTVFGKAVFVDYVARADAGIASISIDGSPYTTLDQYNPSTGGVLTRVQVADNLTNTTHVVRISTTGTKNPTSSGTVIRLRSMSGVGLQDFDNIGAFQVFTTPMASGSSVFKVRQAAAELAVSSTVDGNTVFSGAYHKYCYPRVANNQKLYIDGIMVDFLSMPVGPFRVAYDLRMIQDLILSNASTPIADVGMQHHFTSAGCNVKTNLKWTYPAVVDRSYQAMWPSTADRILLGATQEQYSARRDGSYVFAYPDSSNVLSYHSVDDWVSGFYAHNPYGMRFTNPMYTGMYIWDRSTDFKVYLRKFSGTAVVGSTWNTDVTFYIGHCNSAAAVFNLPPAPRP